MALSLLSRPSLIAFILVASWSYRWFSYVRTSVMQSSIINLCCHGNYEKRGMHLRTAALKPAAAQISSSSSSSSSSVSSISIGTLLRGGGGMSSSSGFNYSTSPNEEDEDDDDDDCSLLKDGGDEDDDDDALLLPEEHKEEEGLSHPRAAAAAAAGADYYMPRFQTALEIFYGHRHPKDNVTLWHKLHEKSAKWLQKLEKLSVSWDLCTQFITTGIGGRGGIRGAGEGGEENNNLLLQKKMFCAQLLYKKSRRLKTSSLSSTEQLQEENTGGKIKNITRIRKSLINYIQQMSVELYKFINDYVLSSYTTGRRRHLLLLPQMAMRIRNSSSYNPKQQIVTTSSSSLPSLTYQHFYHSQEGNYFSMVCRALAALSVGIGYHNITDDLLNVGYEDKRSSFGILECLKCVAEEQHEKEQEEEQQKENERKTSYHCHDSMKEEWDRETETDFEEDHCRSTFQRLAIDECASDVFQYIDWVANDYAYGSIVNTTAPYTSCATSWVRAASPKKLNTSSLAERIVLALALEPFGRETLKNDRIGELKAATVLVKTLISLFDLTKEKHEALRAAILTSLAATEGRVNCEMMEGDEDGCMRLCELITELAASFTPKLESLQSTGVGPIYPLLCERIVQFTQHQSHKVAVLTLQFWRDLAFTLANSPSSMLKKSFRAPLIQVVIEASRLATIPVSSLYYHRDHHNHQQQQQQIQQQPQRRRRTTTTTTTTTTAYVSKNVLYDEMEESRVDRRREALVTIRQISKVISPRHTLKRLSTALNLFLKESTLSAYLRAEAIMKSLSVIAETCLISDDTPYIEPLMQTTLVQMYSAQRKTQNLQLKGAFIAYANGCLNFIENICQWVSSQPLLLKKTIDVLVQLLPIAQFSVASSKAIIKILASSQARKKDLLRRCNITAPSYDNVRRALGDGWNHVVGKDNKENIDGNMDDYDELEIFGRKIAAFVVIQIPFQEDQQQVGFRILSPILNSLHALTQSNKCNGDQDNNDICANEEKEEANREQKERTLFKLLRVINWHLDGISTFYGSSINAPPHKFTPTWSSTWADCIPSLIPIDFYWSILSSMRVKEAIDDRFDNRAEIWSSTTSLLIQVHNYYLNILQLRCSHNSAAINCHSRAEYLKQLNHQESNMVSILSQVVDFIVERFLQHYHACYLRVFRDLIFLPTTVNENETVDKGDKQNILEKYKQISDVIYDTITGPEIIEFHSEMLKVYMEISFLILQFATSDYLSYVSSGWLRIAKFAQKSTSTSVKSKSLRLLLEYRQTYVEPSELEQTVLLL